MLLGFCLHKNALGFSVKHIYKMFLGFVLCLCKTYLQNAFGVYYCVMEYKHGFKLCIMHNLLFNIVVCNMLYYIVYKILYNT